MNEFHQGDHPGELPQLYIKNLKKRKMPFSYFKIAVSFFLSAAQIFHHTTTAVDYSILSSRTLFLHKMCILKRE